MADRIKVFQDPSDAVDFVYECGLEWTSVPGYRFVDGEYRLDDEVADVVRNTDW